MNRKRAFEHYLLNNSKLAERTIRSYVNSLDVLTDFVNERELVDDVVHLYQQPSRSHIARIQADERYEAFNQEKHGIFNTALNYYERYLTFEDTYGFDVFRPVREHNVQTIEAYAKERADHRCELDPSHETFTDRRNGLPFVETAYIIPLAYQHRFEENLRRLENIVVLCPLCRARLDYAPQEERDDVLRQLYAMKKPGLQRHFIQVRVEDLCAMYEAMDES